MSDKLNNEHHKDSESSQNLYSNQYEQDQLAGLEENAPQLNAPVDRTVNKKAIAFIVAAGFGLAGLGAFAYHQFSGTEETPPPERPQVVTVPDLPTPEPQATQIPPVDLVEEQKPDSESSKTTESVTPPIETLSPPIIDTPPPIIPNIPVQPADMYANTDSKFVEDGEAAQKESGAGIAQANAVRYMHNRDKLLLQGTYLRCVLETKIVSEVKGFTSCIITEPVYSASGKYLLLPKGSKVMGQYGSSNPTGPRMEVIWNRIITPEGVDVTLESPGVDNLGAAGHVGKFKSHWGSRLASALLISMISDAFKYAATEYGPQGQTVTTNTSTTTNPYESDTANTLKQQAISQLERNNARPNTVTINQGTLINIYTAQDIDFSSVMQ
ncbi:TrbI/VirB10 family protein [Neisseria subflava]|uniref:TrbI/VirB10 family protein n=1 Tax=Neisseria subflava TaxID=28449 RepID=UPI0027E11D5D|nr:TrbI/VirB10 family protein [Neisseria subflava]